MTEDPKAKSVVAEYERLKSDRSTYEVAWKDIRRLVRPNTVDFQSTRSPGDVRTDHMYDGTAMQANTDLANAVHSFLINPSERNFGLKASAASRELNDDPDAQ